MDESYADIAVVGAGPCGLAVGAAARRAGLRAVLFDRGPLCASLVHYPPYMRFFSTPEKLEVEGLPFVTSGTNPTRREALAYYRGVARYFDLDVRQYREAHPYWDQDVVVVDGGNSAVEAALELFRTGARVTLVHFEADFDPGVKPWILPDIRNRIREGEVAVRWGHRVTEIRPDAVVLREEGTGRIREVPNDWVLALTGWHPDPTLLRALGAAVHAETGVPEHDPETMETRVPGVFVAGVVAAGFDANRIFIENGRLHGRRIVSALGRRAGGPGAPGGS